MLNRTMTILLAAGLTACEPMPTAVPTDVPPAPTGAPAPPTLPIVGADVLAAFVEAGLEAADPRPMTAEDRGLAPYLCADDATRFLIPALGPDRGGRVYACGKVADADLLAAYYDSLSGAGVPSHVFRGGSGHVLVQINGELADDVAAQYGAVLAGMGE